MILLYISWWAVSMEFCISMGVTLTDYSLFWMDRGLQSVSIILIFMKFGGSIRKFNVLWAKSSFSPNTLVCHKNVTEAYCYNTQAKLSPNRESREFMCQIIASLQFSTENEEKVLCTCCHIFLTIKVKQRLKYVRERMMLRRPWLWGILLWWEWDPQCWPLCISQLSNFRSINEILLWSAYFSMGT